MQIQYVTFVERSGSEAAAPEKPWSARSIYRGQRRSCGHCRRGYPVRSPSTSNRSPGSSPVVGFSVGTNLYTQPRSTPPARQRESQTPARAEVKTGYREHLR